MSDCRYQPVQPVSFGSWLALTLATCGAYLDLANPYTYTQIGSSHATNMKIRERKSIICFFVLVSILDTFRWLLAVETCTIPRFRAQLTIIVSHGRAVEQGHLVDRQLHKACNQQQSRLDGVPIYGFHLLPLFSLPSPPLPSAPSTSKHLGWPD